MARLTWIKHGSLLASSLLRRLEAESSPASLVVRDGSARTDFARTGRRGNKLHQRHRNQSRFHDRIRRHRSSVPCCRCWVAFLVEPRRSRACPPGEPRLFARLLWSHHSFERASTISLHQSRIPQRQLRSGRNISRYGPRGIISAPLPRSSRQYFLLLRCVEID